MKHQKVSERPNLAVADPSNDDLELDENEDGMSFEFEYDFMEVDLAQEIQLFLENLIDFSLPIFLSAHTGGCECAFDLKSQFPNPASYSNYVEKLGVLKAFGYQFNAEVHCACHYRAPLIAFDLYANGTTIPKSGAQSACVIRIRPVNIRARSCTGTTLGLPHKCPQFLRTEIQGKAARNRMNTLVSDQPQERSFLSLKAVGSFMDCSKCLMPSLAYSQQLGIEAEQIHAELLSINGNDSIYQLQASPDNAVPRNVRTEVTFRHVPLRENHDDESLNIRSIVRTMLMDLQAVMTSVAVDDARSAILGICNNRTNRQQWKEIQQRYDAVEYYDEQVVRKGILHMPVIRSTSRSREKERLEECEAQPHNRNIVHEFNLRRYKYKRISAGYDDIVLDCVSCTSLRRVLPITRFPRRSIRFSILQCPAGLPETPQERMLARFFLVNGVQYTALPEAGC
eukprot:IDg4211t1